MKHVPFDPVLEHDRYSPADIQAGTRSGLSSCSLTVEGTALLDKHLDLRVGNGLPAVLAPSCSLISKRCPRRDKTTHFCWRGIFHWHMEHIHTRCDFIGIRGTQQSSNHNLDFALVTDTAHQGNVSYCIVQQKPTVYLPLLHLGQILGVWSPSALILVGHPTVEKCVRWTQM